jgi:hypothetical protein
MATKKNKALRLGVTGRNVTLSVGGMEAFMPGIATTAYLTQSFSPRRARLYAARLIELAAVADGTSPLVMTARQTPATPTATAATP